MPSQEMPTYTLPLSPPSQRYVKAGVQRSSSNNDLSLGVVSTISEVLASQVACLLLA